jgi:hypothetical protein
VAHLSQGDKYKNIIWKLPRKTKVFGFLGADHLGTKIIINDETLVQFSEFTYLDCSICYNFSNDVESKLEKLLQLIGTTKGTIFRKARTETILKIYNTSFTYIFIWVRKLDCNSLTKTKNWSGRNEVIRPLAGYTLYDHLINDYICHKLRIIGIIGKIDEYRWNCFQCLQRMPQNRIPLKSYYYRPQGRRTTGRPKKRWRDHLSLWRQDWIRGSNPWCLWLWWAIYVYKRYIYLTTH